MPPPHIDDIAASLPPDDAPRPRPLHHPPVGIVLGWDGYDVRAATSDYRRRAAALEDLTLPPDDAWADWQFAGMRSEAFHIESDRTAVAWSEIERYGADPKIGRSWAAAPEPEDEPPADYGWAGDIAMIGDADLLRDFDRIKEPYHRATIALVRKLVGRRHTGVTRGVLLDWDEYVSGLFVTPRLTAVDFAPDGAIRLGYVVNPTVVALPGIRPDIVAAATAAAIYRMASMDLVALLSELPAKAAVEVETGALAGPPMVSAVGTALRDAAEDIDALPGLPPLPKTSFADPTVIALPD